MVTVAKIRRVEPGMTLNPIWGCATVIATALPGAELAMVKGSVPTMGPALARRWPAPAEPAVRVPPEFTVAEEARSLEKVAPAEMQEVVVASE